MSTRVAFVTCYVASPIVCMYVCMSSFVVATQRLQDNSCGSMMNIVGRIEPNVARNCDNCSCSHSCQNASDHCLML
jgi:hypothetical protein